MLIVLLDEPWLFVFRSAAEAAREIEPIDAESEIRAAFDETGTPYRVEWLRPNRNRRFLFGLLESIAPGEYRFVPSGPPDLASLTTLLERHVEQTAPPEVRALLESLLASIAAH